MCPALSFSGETSIGPFWKLILEGKKTQTIRDPRKRPIKVGDTLVLYWKQRTPIKQKPIHYIGTAKCIEAKRVTLADLWNDEENARADGFGSLKEFRSWFFFEPLSQPFDLIKWKYPLIPMD